MTVIPQTGPVVTDAGSRDVHFAVALHLTALPASFFSSLGVRFLRCYYRMFVLGPHAVLLIANVDGEPAGILAGTIDDVGHVRWATRRYWLRLAAIGFLALLGRPALFWHFLRTRWRRYASALFRLRQATADTAGIPSIGAPGQAGTLTHIAVDEAGRGDGVGRALVYAYQGIAAERGAERVTASTRRGEAGASGFYARLGWRSTGQTTDLDGREFDRWRLDM